MAESKKRILLVDDEPDILLTTGKRLEIAGFELLTAEDGEQALQKAQELPDLIILDLMLPKRSGLDVCATLRKDNRFDKTPIILYTAKGGDDVLGRLGHDQKALREWGADGYVQKNDGPAALLSKVNELLAAHR